MFSLQVFLLLLQHHLTDNLELLVVVFEPSVSFSQVYSFYIETIETYPMMFLHLVLVADTYRAQLQ